MPTRDELRRYLDDYLKAHEIRDYCPNGLQVEGKSDVSKIALGVTSSLEFLQQATVWGADAAIVHHGLFWGKPVRIERSLRSRLGTLISHNTNLFAYHLPLDRHPDVGNNVELARRLGASSTEPAFEMNGKPIGVVAKFESPLAHETLTARIRELTAREPTHIAGGPDSVTTLGIVTGAAPEYLRESVTLGIDAYLTGEPAEWANHIALGRRHPLLRGRAPRYRALRRAGLGRAPRRKLRR